jgi:hypothetical protein
MGSLFNRLLSYVFYLSYKLRTARWLIAIGLGWWGLVAVDANPARGHLLWSVAVGLLVVTYIAQACRFVIFRRDRRAPSSTLSSMPTVLRGRATGDFTMYYYHGTAPGFGFNVGVQIRWKEGYRPPFLTAITPANLDLKYGYEECKAYSEWYPGSQVETCWFWVAGRECYGLRLSFAGRFLLLELPEAETAAVQVALAG